MELEINKVYNCDCLDLMREMLGGGVKADCVITDPPYLINYKTNHRKNKGDKFCKVIANDNDPDFIARTIPLIYEVMKDNSPLYMFCGSDKVDFFKQETEKYFTIKNLIVWDKGNWTVGDLYAQYGKGYEFIIYANKGRALFNNNAKRYSDIWRFPRISGDEQIHQNQKPTDLICRMLTQSTKEGDLILDPFMGSFTTAVCCHRLNRRFIGAELDKEYFEKGQERLNAEMAQISIFDLKE